VPAIRDPWAPDIPRAGRVRRVFPAVVAVLALGASAVLAVPDRPELAEVRPTEVRLALDGRAAHPVVVSGNASPEVRAAAADLADYLGRIASARFDVVEGDGTEGIAVGTAADFPALAGVVASAAFAPEDPLRRDEYLLRTHDRGLWLLGATQTGAEHAVWDCLRRLGYRLFFPTDTWEVVPARADLRLAVDLVARPNYVVRRAPRGAPWSNDELWRRWRVRNREASDFSLATSHTYDTIIRAHAAASVPPATAAGWHRQLRISSIASYPRCLSGNG